MDNQFIENMCWSYSRIKCFDDCPYRFYLQYISKCEERDTFYSTYGLFMHKLIERYYKNELPKEELPMEFLMGFSENVHGVRPSETTVQNYIKGGLQYLEGFQPFQYKMIDVEKRVHFNIDKLEFIGQIDYIGELNGEYVIIDNKSRDIKPRSKRRNPTVKDAELDSMLKQLYLYSVPVQMEFGKFPKFLCFNCFRTGAFIQEPFQKSAYNEAIAWAKDKIEEIKTTDDFHPNINYYPCRYICGFSDECEYAQEAFQDRRD